MEDIKQNNNMNNDDEDKKKKRRILLGILIPVTVGAVAAAIISPVVSCSKDKVAKYTINLETDGNGTLNKTSIEVTKNTVWGIAREGVLATAKSGFKFKEWQKDGQTLSDSYPITSAFTAKAIFETISASLTLSDEVIAQGISLIHYSEIVKGNKLNIQLKLPTDTYVDSAVVKIGSKSYTIPSTEALTSSIQDNVISIPADLMDDVVIVVDKINLKKVLIVDESVTTQGITVKDKFIHKNEESTITLDNIQTDEYIKQLTLEIGGKTIAVPGDDGVTVDGNKIIIPSKLMENTQTITLKSISCEKTKIDQESDWLEKYAVYLENFTEEMKAHSAIWYASMNYDDGAKIADKEITSNSIEYFYEEGQNPNATANLETDETAKNVEICGWPTQDDEYGLKEYFKKFTDKGYTISFSQSFDTLSYKITSGENLIEEKTFNDHTYITNWTTGDTTETLIECPNTKISNITYTDVCPIYKCNFDYSASETAEIWATDFGKWTSKPIVIPDKVSDSDGDEFPVTRFREDEGKGGTGAFSSCYTSSITLENPKNFVTIPSYCFANCTNLKEFTIPSTVYFVSGYAFAGSGVEKVYFENTKYWNYDGETINVADPEENATNLKGTTYIVGGGIECSITDETNTFKITPEGDLSLIEGAATEEETIDIPAEIKGITVKTVSGFNELSKLKTLTFQKPENITKLRDGAFENCKHLETIPQLPNLEEIGISTFQGCEALKTITLSSKLTKLGVDAFAGCVGLTSIILPDSLIDLPYECFLNCTSLANITLGQYTKWISVKAFQNCPIEEINIPATVEWIGANAFYWDDENSNSPLKRVNFSKTDGWRIPEERIEKDAYLLSTSDPLQNAKNFLNFDGEATDRTNWGYNGLQICPKRITRIDEIVLPEGWTSEWWLYPGEDLFNGTEIWFTKTDSNAQPLVGHLEAYNLNGDKIGGTVSFVITYDTRYFLSIYDWSTTKYRDDKLTIKFVQE